jgi:hypothetical protein
VLVSFLICGLDFRPWQKIRDKIEFQISDSGYQCEVLCNVDSGESSSGKKRNELTAAASGEYIAFIDDDDDVSGEYVKSICDAVINDRPDVVSFIVDVNLISRVEKKIGNKANQKERRASESWTLGLLEDNREKGGMSANHLCCWKKDIAKRVKWSEKLGYGDDQLWYGSINAMNPERTCEIIHKKLYRYDFNTMLSMNQTSSKRAYSWEYFGIGLRCFLVDSVLLIEDGSQREQFIDCFSPVGENVKIDTSLIKPFHTVRLI